MGDLALGRQFAGVLAWDSLFHLSQGDPCAVLPRFATHAAPGAALMFTSGAADGLAIGRFAGELLFHGSLAPEAYRALLGCDGFTPGTQCASNPDFGGRTVWAWRTDG